MAKEIKFNLSVAGIDYALKEIERYKQEFLQKCTEALKELVAIGVTTGIIQITALGAVDTGDLADGMRGEFYPEQHTGIVYNERYYAVFVEYGTGVAGSVSQHPAQPWAYDVNEHGEDGWKYVGKDGHVHWTIGQPSRPFFYNTFRELQKQMPEKYKRKILEIQ